MSRKFWIITSGIVALLACSSAIDSCGCSPAPFFEKHLVGFVKSGNSPVTSARVSAVFLASDCNGPKPTSTDGDTEDVVDQTGHYQINLGGYAPDTLCARLAARSGSDSLVRDSVEVIMSTRRDSVQVNFTFP